MDIQKEREAFERHASKFFTDSKEAFKTNGDQYLYDEVIWMWDCWIERAKAQAVPEGFVVVPRQPNEKTLIKMSWSVALGEDQHGNSVYLSIDEAKQAYEAVIEAQEQD